MNGPHYDPGHKTISVRCVDLLTYGSRNLGYTDNLIALVLLPLGVCMDHFADTNITDRRIVLRGDSADGWKELRGIYTYTGVFLRRDCAP
jgi:hypothetical protein